MSVRPFVRLLQSGVVLDYTEPAIKDVVQAFADDLAGDDVIDKLAAIADIVSLCRAGGEFESTAGMGLAGLLVEQVQEYFATQPG